LRLAQDLGEVGDSQVRFGKQSQHAQARTFAGRTQRAVERFEIERRRTHRWDRSQLLT